MNKISIWSPPQAVKPVANHLGKTGRIPRQTSPQGSAQRSVLYGAATEQIWKVRWNRIACAVFLHNRLGRARHILKNCVKGKITRSRHKTMADQSRRSLEPVVHGGEEIQFGPAFGDRTIPCIVLKPAGRQRNRTHPFLREIATDIGIQVDVPDARTGVIHRQSGRSALTGRHAEQCAVIDGVGPDHPVQQTPAAST